MRLLLLPLCAAAAVAAPAVERDAMLRGYSDPAQRWTGIEQAVAEKDCADRIEQIRDTTGQPKLDRAPVSADKPLLIAAVDKRIDGCSVLLMKNDVNDIRPVPATADGAAVLLPAE
jgi:hypothetical protein